jgi:hypothetical protein
MRYKTFIKQSSSHTRIEVMPLDTSSKSPLVIKLNESEYQSLKAAIRAELVAELAQEQSEVDRDNFLIMRCE